jgi:hypothetical protein
MTSSGKDGEDNGNEMNLTNQNSISKMKNNSNSSSSISTASSSSINSLPNSPAINKNNIMAKDEPPLLQSTSSSYSLSNSNNATRSITILKRTNSNNVTPITKSSSIPGTASTPDVESDSSSLSSLTFSLISIGAILKGKSA